MLLCNIPECYQALSPTETHSGTEHRGTGRNPDKPDARYIMGQFLAIRRAKLMGYTTFVSGLGLSGILYFSGKRSQQYRQELPCLSTQRWRDAH